MSEQALGLPRRFAALVKIEHTVFALPFAYVGALLAVDGVPSAGDLLWITRRDGRGPLAGDGPEPARRRGDRRAKPAYGRQGAPARCAEPSAGLGFLRESRSRCS